MKVCGRPGRRGRRPTACRLGKRIFIENADTIPAMDRRNFVRASTAAFTALSYSRVLGANDRVSLGFIGLGNRGDQVLTAFLEHGDSRIDALCDLRQDYMDHAKGRAEKRGERRFYTDYRKLLESAADAVVISTPDHWHALQTIHACQAGKDVTSKSRSA